MDQESDFKKARDLLIDNFSIIDFDGDVRYLNHDNVKDVLEGHGNPATLKLSYYRKSDIRLQQERLMSKNTLALERGDWSALHTAWGRSPDTKFYKGVAFDPLNKDPTRINLWRGHAIEPKEGNCDIIDELLWKVLSNQSHEKYNYLMNFLAHALQKPSKKPEIMPVFYGGQGTGKGSFGELITAIWPYTTLMTQNVDEVVGQFTGSLERAYFVLLDEALFSGDRKSANSLKSKISEKKMRIAEKNQPSRTIDSYHRFIAFTNEEKFATVARDDRRFYVCEVSDDYKQDRDFFGRYYKALEDESTLAAFVHKLMNRDLTDFEVRDRPITAEHAQQKIESLDGFNSYVYDLLDSGQFTGDILPMPWSGSLRIGTQRIKEHYLQFDKHAERYGAFSEKKIISNLRKIFPSLGTPRWDEGGQKVRGVLLPPLKTARKQFDKYMNCSMPWDDESSSHNNLYEKRGLSGTSGLRPVTYHMNNEEVV